MCIEKPRAGPLSDPGVKRNESPAGASVDGMCGMTVVSHCKLMNSVHNDGTGTSQAVLGLGITVPNRPAELLPPALGGMHMTDMHT